MARRKGQTTEIVCTPLEEHTPVKYVIVGRPEWIDTMFEPEALKDIRQVRVSSASDLSRVKEWLDKRNRHFIDTETTGENKRCGLDPWHPGSRMLMMQIGNQDLVFVIQPELIPEFKEFLESDEILHVMQNAVFDWKYIYKKHNVHINKIYDTMLAEQLLTSGKLGMKVNLAAISRRRPPHRIILKAVRKEFIVFTGKFTKEMVYYAARDIVLLPDIMESQQKQLAELEMEVVAQDEFNLIPVTGSMELGGVPFSPKTLRLALSYWEKRQTELEAQILSLFDTRMVAKGADNLFIIPGMKFEFDVGSQAQKLAALRALGHEIEDVKRDTLDELDDPIAKLLGEYSNTIKITSTYGENMIKRVNPETGRLHVEFNQLGHGDIEAKAGKATTIATGRYSSDFQQLPKSSNRFEEVKGNELIEITDLFKAQISELLKEAI